MRVNRGCVRVSSVRHVQPLRAASYVVRVHGSAYQMVLSCATRAPEYGDRVLHVPLNAHLTREFVDRWRLWWHCDECTATHAVAASGGAQPPCFKVVPRRIDGAWSQGALVRLAPFADDAERAAAKERDHDATLGVDSAVVASAQPRAPALTRADCCFGGAVDLMQNASLLRALLDVPVCVHVLPPHDARHGDSAIELANVGRVRRLYHRGQWLAYDVCTGDGRALNGAQLLRAVHEQQMLALPLMSRDVTLRAFVLQHEAAQTQQRRQRAWPAAGANGSNHHRADRSLSWRRRAAAPSAAAPKAGQRSLATESMPDAKRAAFAPRDRNCFSERHARAVDEDDDAIDRWAQRLLNAVDALVPPGAVGVLIRPFDAESTAFVHQQCPYTQFLIGAYVPALSQLWPSVRAGNAATNSSNSANH